MFGDSLQQALATPGLGLLVLAVFLAGLVRGFTGFGTAMVYMPFAGSVLEPLSALMTMIVFDFFGPLPNVPRAIRHGAPRDILRLVLGALIGLPLGLAVIYRIEPEVFRWLVSLLSLGLLLLLISGWRYNGELNRPMVVASGGVGGFLSGVCGLAGPPVIMLYMASRKPLETVRANILLYLVLGNISTFLLIGLSGRLDPVALLIGAMLILPFLLANMIGGALFRPEQVRTYRVIAYLLIAASALSNLPLFG